MTDISERIANLSPAKRRLLERRLAEMQQTSGETDSLQPRTDNAPVPLSFGQQRFWFIHELESDKPLFNNVSAARVLGPLDSVALEKAYRAIIARHEILRTVYRAGADGEPMQHVLQDWSFEMRRIDLRDKLHDIADPDAYLNALLVDEARRRFDLTQDLSMRAVLYVLGEQDYIFCEVHHHIATDFWSSGILRREVAALYDAFRQGKTESEANKLLPTLPIQYADFAIWQRRQEKTPAFARHVDFWRRKLHPPLPTLTLPIAAPRPAVQQHRGASAEIFLTSEQVQQMQDLGRGEGATIFIVLATAFLTLFQRYSRQNDLVTGVITAGRNLSELDDLIGSFINTLIFRVDASGNPTFREFLRRVHQVGLDAFDHQDVPFERVVAELQPERTLSAQPLVEIIFDFLNAPGSSALPPGVEWTPISVSKGTAEYDILIMGRPMAHGMQIGIRFKSDLFNAAAVQRMLGHLNTLLDAALAAPDTPIATLPLADEAERRLLVGWNDTALALPQDRTYTQLFEQQVRTTPQSIAVRDGLHSLSYAQLNARANRLARALQTRGVESGHIVALLAARNVDFLSTMLAIWKLGAAYLPIDPRLPSARVRQILQQSQANPLLVDASLAELGERSLSPTLPTSCVDLADLLAEKHRDDNLTASTTPDDLAYVIYTSGSTGLPKGAMVEHKGMLNHLFAKVHDLRLTSTDIVAQNSPQSFDISVWQFLVALLVGAQTTVFADEIAFDPIALLEQVNEQGITIFESVPSMLRAMLDYADVGKGHRHLAQLRWLIPTGEAMPPSLARAWFERYPHLKLMNAYGPTECSDDVTHFIMTGPPPREMTNLPIGRPVANMQIHILDDAMQTTPLGVPGEIYVSGVGVGRGYLHDPERTAAAFISDPFNLDADSRMYRTGDLGRWLDSGVVEFLGRVDFQVKVRGHRIELGEIENALLKHPAVTEAAALALEDGADSRRLVAYVALSDGQPFDAATGSAHLSDLLPPYMVPASYLTFTYPATLPKTNSGKIDRTALAALDVAPAANAEFVPPATETEIAIAVIWSDLLGIETIGVKDNFFELGGHSLIAAQMVHRLRQSLAPGLSLRSLFEHPTIASLSDDIIDHETVPGCTAQAASVFLKVISMSDEGLRAAMIERLDAQRSGIE